MTLPRMGDSDDRTTELLNAILREVSDWQAPEIEVAEGDQIVNQGDQVLNRDVTNRSNQTVNQGDVYGSGPGQRGSARFTTGPTGVNLEEAGLDHYRDISFGFAAGTVNIRSDAALYIAFDDPNNNPGRLIPIAADEFAFTIGGSNPIDAETIWLTHQDETAGPSEVHIIAYR